MSAKEDEAELAKQREEQAVIRYNMAMTEKEESVKAEEKRLSGEELNILAEKEGGIMNVTREVLLTAHEINVRSLEMRAHRPKPKMITSLRIAPGAKTRTLQGSWKPLPSYKRSPTSSAGSLSLPICHLTYSGARAKKT